MLTLLRHRDFGLLWSAGLISVTGDWVLNSALPYFVYQQTGSTLATAGMTVAELLPGVLLSSLAGVFVDRWDRARVLVRTNLLLSLSVLLLLLCSDGGSIWAVYVVGLAASALQSFSEPAESSLLPTLVGPDELIGANALNALNNRLGRLIGLPLGAALLAAFGLRAVVLLDCVTFAAAAALIRLIGKSAGMLRRTDDEPAAEEARSAVAHFVHEWMEGLRLVRREPTIALVFVVLGFMTYGGTMLDPLTPGWVRDVLDAGPATYAWLLTAHAVGGILGSLVIGTLGRILSPRHLMGWFSIVACTLLLVKYNVPVVWVALGLSLLGGAASVASSVGANTLVQQSIPERYRGRVFGSLGATAALLSLCGAMTGGLLGGLIGIVPTLDLASGLVGLAGLVVLVVYSGERTSRAADDEAAPALGSQSPDSCPHQ